MKILKSSIAAALLFGLCSAVQGAPQAWEGEYAYAGSHGTSQGGSAIAVDYLVRIAARGSSPVCEIEITGYQRFEEILCTTKASGDSLTLHFKSYKSGDTKNAYGVQIYRSGQPLLAFQRTAKAGKRVLYTRWLGLRDSEGSKPQSDETFVRVPVRK